ncbi:MAG: cytochrome ubiquinol oxidase subunit I [Acidobacteriota bacterium]
MESALAVGRLQFAFTITYHYLFPQLTMGLALLIVLLKTAALWSGGRRYDGAVRFWTRIFGINFAMGVVTGIPMEFQFGTNWAGLSRAAGGVIGQTLAMEGVLSFFLESTFLGLLLFGERRLGPIGHWAAAALVFLGAWSSGFFIVATNAWMQHPVGYALAPSGEIRLQSLGALLSNPWVVWQYLHTMSGAAATASFVMAAVGAFYLISGRHGDHGRIFLRFSVPVGLAASVLLAFPTGDLQAQMTARHKPAAFAAMEGLFETEAGAPIVLVGQPDMDERRLDNPIFVPRLLSFLTHRRWRAEIKGLDAYPMEDWPDNIPLLYYAYHIMVGLGTMLIAVMGLAAWSLLRGRLFASRTTLWLLMLMFPFPYIANTAGWLTAELGRQPWVVHGVMRTADAVSPAVSAGNALFTLIGFAGLYTVLSFLFLFLVCREIERGPADPPQEPQPYAAG